MALLGQNTNLSFTMTCDAKRISFLDGEIYIQSDDTLGSTLSCKSTAGNTILRANSDRPKKKTIVLYASLTAMSIIMAEEFSSAHLSPSP